MLCGRCHPFIMLRQSQFHIIRHPNIKSSINSTLYHVHFHNLSLQMLPACRQAGIQLSYAAIPFSDCKYSQIFDFKKL